MILDYNLDTKEDEIQPRSIELRKRFATRRITAAIENGVFGAEDIVHLKESNKDFRSEHHRETYVVVCADSTNKVTLARAEQQLTIQKSLRAIDKDVTRASRLGKARVDTLTDLEKRIEQLRTTLRKPNFSQTVDQIVDDELLQKGSLTLDKNFVNCAKCGRRIISAFHDAHYAACKSHDQTKSKEYEKEPVYDINIHPSITLATFPPQPPRQCHFIRKGCNFMEFGWSPPIIDGGLPIFEYEIRYKIVYRNFDLIDKIWRTRIDDKPIQKTSW